MSCKLSKSMSGKNKKNTINLLSAAIAHRVVKVKLQLSKNNLKVSNKYTKQELFSSLPVSL